MGFARSCGPPHDPAGGRRSMIQPSRMFSGRLIHDSAGLTNSERLNQDAADQTTPTPKHLQKFQRFSAKRVLSMDPVGP